MGRWRGALMSQMGQSRPSHSANAPTKVRHASNGDHSRYESELTQSARTRLDHIGDLLAGDPPGNRRPILFQGTGSHKQPNMLARYGLLHDFTLRRSDIFGGIKDLLSCRDVITRAGQQIRGASDIVEIK